MDEAEYLNRQLHEARLAIKRALRDAGNNLGIAVSPGRMLRNHPYASTGVIVGAAGAAAAVIAYVVTSRGKKVRRRPRRTREYVVVQPNAPKAAKRGRTITARLLRMALKPLNHAVTAVLSAAVATLTQREEPGDGTAQTLGSNNQAGELHATPSP